MCVQRRNFRENQELYVSPQLFCALVKGKQKVKFNPYKNEVFAFGLVVLELSLLHSIQQIYDFRNGTINKEIFLYHLDNFMEIYGSNDLLRELLIKMLEFDEKLRMDPLELSSLHSHLQSLLQPQKEGSGDWNDFQEKGKVPTESTNAKELIQEEDWP